MTLSLTPSELQIFTDQLVAAFLPAFHKAVQKASKATDEALDCLTVETTAKRLKCDPKTVRRYIKDDKLRASNFGTLRAC